MNVKSLLVRILRYLIFLKTLISFSKPFVTFFFKRESIVFREIAYKGNYWDILEIVSCNETRENQEEDSFQNMAREKNKTFLLQTGPSTTIQIGENFFSLAMFLIFSANLNHKSHHPKRRARRSWKRCILYHVALFNNFFCF